MCILSVKFGGRMVPHGGRIWPNFGNFCLIKNRWPNLRTTIIRNAVLGLFCSNFLGMLSTINTSLVSDDYVCRKQGLAANIKLGFIENFSWQQTLGLRLFWFTVNETLLGLSLLVTGKGWDLGRIRFEDSCNSISFCKETHIIIVEQRVALSPKLGHH